MPKTILVLALGLALSFPVHPVSANEWWVSVEHKDCVTGETPAHAFEEMRRQLQAEQAKGPFPPGSVMDKTSHDLPLLLDDGNEIQVGIRSFDDDYLYYMFFRDKAQCEKRLAAERERHVGYSAASKQRDRAMYPDLDKYR